MFHSEFKLSLFSSDVFDICTCLEQLKSAINLRDLFASLILLVEYKNFGDSGQYIINHKWTTDRADKTINAIIQSITEYLEMLKY